MIRQMAFFAAILLASAAGAQDNQDLAARFGAREGVEQINISPDGRRVVYLTPGSGASTAVVVQELSEDAQPLIAFRSDGNPERVRWCQFAGNERLVCQITALIPESGTFVGFERLVSLSLDGGDPRLLGQRNARQFDGSIIDWLPDQPGFVLMERSGGVYRVDVRTLRLTTAEMPNRNAGGFMTDGRGNVRIMIVGSIRGATGMAGSRVSFFYRTLDSQRWRPLGEYDTLTSEGLYPVAVDPASNAAYVLRKLDGRRALYRITLDGSMTAELVHANEQVDVDGVVRIGRGTQVIGVTFADETRRKVYFDPAFAELARNLGRALPNLPLIDFVESSVDGDSILVHASSDSDPGRYFVYHKTNRNLNEIALDRPQLEQVRLATVRPVTYPATDGVNVPAYLTLPPGSDGRNLPAVLLPHGGPEARDELGFDWLAQYLAQLGYAVLQPNYRGSAGYGDQWLQENGFRSWQTSVGDITAGARWLVSQGIAEPNRMAIVGWSYGGYAALQSGVADPHLFRAIVAIAPVTDLQQLKDDARMFTSRRNVAEYVGTGTHIVQGSPLRNAASIEAPVLLFHGDRDVNVPVIHSQRMDRAMREAGHQSELVVFPNLEHDLADSEARRRMLDQIRTFLAGRLGPSQAVASSATP